MHILHLVDALYLGGAERMLVELANRSVQDGHRVSVCVSRALGERVSQLDRRIELISLSRQRRFELRPILRLGRWISANSVDVIHCHGLSSFSFVALLAATRMIKTPLIMHDHRGWADQEAVPTWFRAARRFLAQYVAVDERQLDWARRAGIESSRVRAIPNALDLKALAARSRPAKTPVVEPPRRRLVSVGGLRREKAIDVLLESIALVKSPFTLFVVGGDLDREYASACRARASQPDLAGRVAFLGQRDDALAIAAGADLAVHSARIESGPLVLLEYAAVGLPFVSTRVGGIAASLEKLGAGTFVRPEDPAALAAAIDRALQMSPEARTSSIETLSQAASEFDISRVMPQWYGVYAEARAR